MHLIRAKRSIMNQLHVHCDINDIVSEYLTGVQINPYKSYRWHEVSKVARNCNGTKSKWHEVSDIHWHVSFSCVSLVQWFTCTELNIRLQDYNCCTLVTLLITKWIIDGMLIECWSSQCNYTFSNFINYKGITLSLTEVPDKLTF